MASLLPPPVGSPVSERATLKMVLPWQEWLRALTQKVQLLESWREEVTPTLVPWTPRLVGTAGGSAHTYETQWGSALRTGAHWTVACTIVLTAVDVTMAGAALIEGLPAMIVAPPEAFFPLTVGFSNVNLGGQYSGVFGAMVTGEPALRLYQQGANTGWELLPASGITNATQLAFSGAYWSA